MTCAPIEGLLTRYLLGDLDPADQARVEEHLASCPACRTAVEELRPTVGLLRQALSSRSGDVPRLDPARRARILASYGRRKPQITVLWTVLKAAAVVAILLVFAGLFLPALSMSRSKARFAMVQVHEREGRLGSDLSRNEGASAEDAGAVSGSTRSHGEVAAKAGPTDRSWWFHGRSKAEAGTDKNGLNNLAGQTADFAISSPQPAGTAGSKMQSTYGVGGPPPTDPHALGAGGPPPVDSYALGAGGPPPVESYAAGAGGPPPGDSYAAGVGGPPPSYRSRSRPAKESVELRWSDSGRKEAEKSVAAAAPAPSTPAAASAPFSPPGPPIQKPAGGIVASDSWKSRGGSMPEPTANRPEAVNFHDMDGAGTVDQKKAKTREAPLAGKRFSNANRTELRDKDDDHESRPADPAALVMDADHDGRADRYERRAVADAPAVRAGRPGTTRRLEGNGAENKKSPATTNGRTPVLADDGLSIAAGDAVQSVSTVGYMKVAQASASVLRITEESAKPEGRESEISARRLEAAVTTRPPPPAPVIQPSEPAVEIVYPPQVFNPIVETKQNAFSTFGLDTDTASFTLARRYLLQGRRPPEGAVRVEEFVNAFEYAYRAPERDTFAVYADRARSPFRPSLDVLRIGVRGKVIGRDRMRPSVLTFIIDASGSMNTPDRLDLVRKSLLMLVDHLGPRDTVAIVAFGSEARLVLDQTPAGQKDAIRAAINGLQTYGSTHLEGGMRLGYQVAARNFTSGAINRVLLLSDGVANLGAATADEILAQVERYRVQGIYCSVFGVGQGNYNDTMLGTLADKGDGVYRFVDSPAEAKRVFVDDLAATLCTIAKDVKIQVEFNPERVTRYRQVGYEKRHLEKEQFRDDTVDAGEVGAGQSATALYEIETAGNPAEPLGTVRLRWKDVESGKVEERAIPIKAGDRYATFESAPVRFRLAAGVAEFADLLRRNPNTAGTAIPDVAAALRPVGLELNLDRQVQDLVRMANAVRE